MPVIGRLDGQVEEVIIKPISERRPEAEEPPAPPQSRDTPPAPAERAPSQTPQVDESSADADELPVWLL
ncbi:MAG TPA: hypothetical protein VF588_09710 [Pyrinomonadaceae bacterium]|jgi:hypothetical protein